MSLTVYDDVVYVLLHFSLLYHATCFLALIVYESFYYHNMRFMFRHVYDVFAISCYTLDGFNRV